MERLEAAENEELKKWAPTIRNFSVQYESFVKVNHIPRDRRSNIFFRL